MRELIERINNEALNSVVSESSTKERSVNELAPKESRVADRFERKRKSYRVAKINSQATKLSRSTVIFTVEATHDTLFFS